MKVIKSIFLIGMALLLLGGSSYALDIIINPSVAQRAANTGQVRVQIIAKYAVELISFGIRVSFDPSVLQVIEANKNTDFNTGFMMDGDGDPGTLDDHYTTPVVQINNTEGWVEMIGGRLVGPTGASTTGLSGDVLLGWIVFQGKPGVTGSSSISINIAKAAPYDNFVGISTTPATVYDGDITPGQRATVCIRDASEAREGDMDGSNSVDYIDYAMLSAAWGSSSGDANFNPACDLDGDGQITYIDYAMLSADWGQPVTPCP